jgi:hypothetical protein
MLQCNPQLLTRLETTSFEQDNGNGGTCFRMSGTRRSASLRVLMPVQRFRVEINLLPTVDR